jgi:hypothetical protein
MLILASIISIIFVGSRNPKQYVSKITKWLIFTVPVPYQEKFGLNLSELETLQETAQTEQSAADWRGNYVGIIIIGSIGFLWGVSESSMEWFLKSLPSNFQYTLNAVDSSIAISTTVGWGIFCIIANVFLARLIGYLHDFLISEFSNRAILYACLEAKAILQTQKLEPDECLQIPNKISIAHMLGYELLSSNSLIDKQWIHPEREFIQDGQKWELVESRGKKQIRKSSKKRPIFLKTTRNKISSIFLWLVDIFKQFVAKTRKHKKAG